MSLLTRKDKAIIVFALLIASTSFIGVVWTAITEGTIGYNSVFRTVNATEGYFRGLDNVTGALYGDFGLNDIYTLGSVGATTYQIGALDVTDHLTASLQEVADYIVWGTGATYYTKNGATGVRTGYVTPNAALQAAHDSLASGGVIQLLNGQHNFTSFVAVSNDAIQIIGQGHNTEITQSDGVNLARFFYVTGDNCQLKNLYIHGNKANNINSVGVEVNGVLDFRAEHVQVRYAPSQGFYIYGNTVRARIENCVARDNAYDGIYLKSSTDSFIMHNTLTGNVRHGLFLDTVVGCIVSGNQVLQNVVRGINAYECLLVTIEENICNGNGQAGIRLGGTNAAYNKKNIISGNVCYDNSQTTPNSYHGIYLDGVQVQNNVVSGNTVAGTKHMYGVAENNANNNLIANNELRGQATGSLYVGTGTTVTGNKCDGTSTINAGAKAYGNTGYVTENGGTTTILNGTTSIVITHGLSYTPTSGNTAWTVSYLELPTNDPGSWYIDTMTATQATIHVLRDPGISHLNIAWSARRTP